jgi:MYXO-CTERM domain-containing protein
VQIPLPGLLDARSVTTLTGGKLVVFDLPTDGGNLQNAFATKAVAQMQGKPVENALPDDGKFPADARHPEVVLSFSNDAAATAPQTHLVPPSTSFAFEVPATTYSKFFLFFNGAAGGTTVMITLKYSDGMEIKSAKIPDYYADVPANDPVVFNLATNLAKWDKNTQINEANHHNITGVELVPMVEKTLMQVEVARAAEGNLVFWGATGVATGDVGGGSGGAGGAGGAAGAPASGGPSGTAGAASGGAGAPAGGIAPALGGSAPGGSSSAGSGTSTFTPPPSSTEDVGCGCRLGAKAAGSSWLALVALGGLGRRRRRRC